jgi:preprotein translocase subunit SecA
MRLFKSDMVDRVLRVLKVPDDVPIENKQVTNAIASAQGQVESQNFDSRKNVLKYDDVMDRQRQVIYGERRRVLEGADLEDQVRDFIDDVIRGYVTGATQEYPDDWDLDALFTALGQLYPITLTKEGVVEEAGGVSALSRDKLIDDLKADAHAAYDKREVEVGEEVMRELERQVLLSVLDRKWRDHLYEMDYLREGIYLRAYSQRDPLVEYQREGYDMFSAMMDGIKEEAVGFLFNLEVEVEQEEDGAAEVVTNVPDVDGAAPAIDLAEAASHAPTIRAKGLGRSKPMQKLSYSAPSEDGEAEVHSEVPAEEDPFAGVGRNQLCPCGSGQKFKRCHGAPGGPTGMTTRASG